MSDQEAEVKKGYNIPLIILAVIVGLTLMILPLWWLKLLLDRA